MATTHKKRKTRARSDSPLSLSKGGPYGLADLQADVDLPDVDLNVAHDAVDELCHESSRRRLVGGRAVECLRYRSDCLKTGCNYHQLHPLKPTPLV